MDTFCHTLRWAGLMIIMTATKTGTPAMMMRDSSTLMKNMKMAMNTRLKMSMMKLMMPFESISDTLLT